MDAEVINSIKEGIPEIGEEELQKLLGCLTTLGVRKHADLQFIQESDLTDLTVIQKRKLVAYWKSEYNIIINY